MYEDWLLRAYQGGVRLMVMLAQNSEDMFGRTVGSGTFEPLRRVLSEFPPIVEAASGFLRRFPKNLDHRDIVG